MKAHQDPKPSFQPVTITLESQEEVDTLFAILSDINLTDDTPFKLEENSTGLLEDFVTDNEVCIYDDMVARLKKEYGPAKK